MPISIRRRRNGLLLSSFTQRTKLFILHQHSVSCLHLEIFRLPNIDAISAMRIMIGAISMHVHWSVIRARWIRIPTLGTIILVVSHNIICRLTSLHHMIVLETSTDGTGESIRENGVFRLVIGVHRTRICRTRWIGRHWESWVNRLHCSLRLLLLLEWQPRRWWGFISPMIKLVLHIQWAKKKGQNNVLWNKHTSCRKNSVQKMELQGAFNVAFICPHKNWLQYAKDFNAKRFTWFNEAQNNPLKLTAFCTYESILRMNK